jgi:hypothetical protein
LPSGPQILRALFIEKAGKKGKLTLLTTSKQENKLQ